MLNTILLLLLDGFNQLPVYESHDFDVTPYLTALAGWSSLLGVALALLLFLLMLLLNRLRKFHRLTMPGKVLTTAFVVVWLAGFVIYDVGMYIGHDRLSLITNLPMAIIHAFEMFLLESDVAAIHSQFHDNWIFMGGFSLIHLLAAFITLVFVIKHFGYNIVAGFRMLVEAYLGRKKETFIFWGLDDASYLLAKSIKSHYKHRKDYRIIVVRVNDDKRSSVKNGMERLFNFLSLHDNDLERLMELDCLTTSTYADLAQVIVNSKSPHPDNDILRKHLNLRQLARTLRYKTRGNAHLFFLSQDSSSNIQAVGNLKRDKTVIDFATASSNMITFYCSARYNSVHRVIEDEQHHDRIEVKVIDQSHISVDILKQRVEFHPVSYVDIENNATVSSPFNALVVGFGEIGVDIVRFLYEFSAFVKTGTGENGVAVERSPFCCDVVDPDMKQREGIFIANAPSVMTNLSSAQPSSAQSPFITLHNMDVTSIDFYRYIETHIQQLNYVVIAQDNDEQNVSLAVRIFRLAVRYRRDLKHFRILVLVKNDEDGHLRRVTEHYNRLWAAEEHGEDPIKRTHQRIIANTDCPNSPITIFGNIDEIFSYEYIVRDRLKKQAQVFKQRYDQSIEALMGQKAVDWETEFKELMQLTDDYLGYSPTFSGIMRLRRTQRQNVENCFHQYTKQMLAQVALGDDYKIFSQNCLKRENNQISYTWSTDATPNNHVTRVLDMLARTEHLRWMASHEVLGYMDFGTEDDKDEARLLHGCLKPWESLSTSIKSYDYNVVDVSLGIM